MILKWFSLQLQSMFEIAGFQKSKGEFCLLCHLAVGWDLRSSFTLNEHTDSLAYIELC